MPSFNAEISEQSTLEIVSPLEVAFHFKVSSPLFLVQSVSSHVIPLPCVYISYHFN